MADQKLGMIIDAQSNVPEQMGKAGRATVSFQKQVEDIQKKFSTAFKDIFLGFTAPMVILQNVIGYVSGEIEKAKQNAKEGLDLLSKGESQYATTEQAKTAAFFKRRKELEDEQKLIQAGKEAITKEILTSPEGLGFVLPNQIKARLAAGESISSISQDKGLQEEVMKFFQTSEKGRKIIEETALTGKQKDFKGPEGFSNIVGVGANPVMEAMNEQIEIQKQQLEELKKIANPPGTGPTDFTKTNK